TPRPKYGSYPRHFGRSVSDWLARRELRTDSRADFLELTVGHRRNVLPVCPIAVDRTYTLADCHRTLVRLCAARRLYHRWYYAVADGLFVLGHRPLGCATYSRFRAALWPHLLRYSSRAQYLHR